MTPNRNKTLVGFSLPPQLEEDPFPLSRRISYTRLSQMLPPPVETPKTTKYAISTSADLKRSQSRGGKAAGRAGKLERVFREMDEEAGDD